MNIDAYYSTVINALDACKGSWPAVAQKAGLSYYTLSKISQGAIQNPGIRTIQKIEIAMREMRLFRNRHTKKLIKSQHSQKHKGLSVCTTIPQQSENTL